jgi:ATP-dependent DNA helicase RecQ
MTYGLQDVVLLRRLIDEGGSGERRRVEHLKLNALLGYCETARCRRSVLLEYFGDAPAGPCGNCDTCLEPVETFDGTEAAQKLLSAAVRTGQRFGQGYLIDVLLGNAMERIVRFGHDRIPTFGAGRDLDKRGWQSVARQLVAAGLLSVDVEGYGGLRLAGDAPAVLRGERTVELRRDPSPPARARDRKVRAAGAAAPESPEARALFEALRAKRLEIAREQGVPPYVVFSDRTLLEMAARVPRTPEEMRGIHGVGETKLARYGATFLEVLRAESGREEAVP